jgi:hypothetical protein
MEHRVQGTLKIWQEPFIVPPRVDVNTICRTRSVW